MVKLSSIRSSELTESGLFRATHALDAPLWRSGNNVLFKDGGPQKAPGYSAVAQIPSAGYIRGAEATRNEAGTKRLFCGDALRLFAWDGVVVSTVGSGYSGAVNETTSQAATAWSFARFGDWMLATNGVDPVQVWQGSGSFADLSGDAYLPPSAEISVRRGPHILLFGTGTRTVSGANYGGATWFEWCDEDRPGIWENLSSNAAGNLNIRDMDGAIRAAVPFGDQIAVLSANQLFLVTYEGAPFYFTYKPVLSGIGCTGKMAVVSVNGVLYGYGKQGAWRCDGVSYSYIDTRSMRDWLKDQVDSSQLSKVCVSYDAENEMVLFSLPTTDGENGLTIGYRLPNAAWTVFDWGRSAMVPQAGVFSEPYYFSDQRIYQHNTGTDANSAAMTASVQTKPFDFGDPQAYKAISHLFLQLRRLVGTVLVRVGYQDALDDEIEWSDAEALDDGFEVVDFAAFRAQGRFAVIEVSSAAVGDDWALSGFDIHGAVTGTVR